MGKCYIKYIKNIKDINDILDPHVSDDVKNVNDDVNAGLSFNDVKNKNSINDVNFVTNANDNYFYWVNVIKYVKNIKDIND